LNQLSLLQSNDWKKKIYVQLDIYKKAPYFNETMQVVDEVLKLEVHFLSELNIASVLSFAKYLKLDAKEFLTLTSLDFNTNKKLAADEWALEICKYMQEKHYINAPGGKDFFDVKKYNANEIRIEFIEPKLYSYKQIVDGFITGLSIIDVAMHNSVDEIKEKHLSGKAVQTN
jgi:hypothetical protein